MATNVNLLDRAPDTLITILNVALSAFEDPIGLARPEWRDYSRWDTIVNFDVGKANGIWGFAARSSIGKDYSDPWFPRNWSEGKRVGMYRTGYHVPLPQYTALQNADRWYKAMPARDVIPRVIDLELTGGQSTGKIADVTWGIVEIVYARDGVYPILYSRKNLIERWLKPHWDKEQQFSKLYYWMAQYLWDRTREHPGPPSIPDCVEKEQVVLHQTADKKRPYLGETKRTIVDHDRWEIGNEMEMVDWINTTWGEAVEPPEPPEPIEPVEPLHRVKVFANVLNVRALPDASSQDLGELIKDSVVPVVEESGVWKRIDGWVHGDWTNIV